MIVTLSCHCLDFQTTHNATRYSKRAELEYISDVGLVFKPIDPRRGVVAPRSKSPPAGVRFASTSSVSLVPELAAVAVIATASGRGVWWSCGFSRDAQVLLRQQADNGPTMKPIKKSKLSKVSYQLPEVGHKSNQTQSRRFSFLVKYRFRAIAI